jgi:SPP1 gp7 family putative phage head morphogenesis protein
MKILHGQRLTRAYYEAVQEQIEAIMRASVLDPVRAILAEATTQADEFTNSREIQVLQRALRYGTIQYKDGLFTGDFEAAISGPLRDLGAEFDERRGGFFLSEWVVPSVLKAEAAVANARAVAIHEKVARELERAKQKLELGQLSMEIDPTMPVDAIEEGFKTTAEAIGVETRLPPAARARMEQRYRDNVRPYVAEATAKFIDEVHAVVTDNAAAGYRYDRLVDGIEREVGVSRRKARFIARQETGLFMAAYRQERFSAAGVTCYKWSTSHDARVRPAAGLTGNAKAHAGNHRVLDGQVFSYSTKGPAYLMSSKKPCNPGEDFGCRCVDLAILE